MKIIVSSILLAGIFFCSSLVHALPTPSFDRSVYLSIAEPVYQYKIIQAPCNTWGYDILRDNTIFIHQPNRPGLPGTGGFSTKKDAIKVAELVIAKIKKGEMPPTVSTEELEALKLAD